MKQKTLLFLLVLCLTGMAAQAQIVTTRSRLVTKVKKPKKPPFEKTFYLAGGGKINTVENKYFKFRPGYEVAVGYEQNFRRSRLFGSQFGFELGLTSRGYAYEQLGVQDKHTFPAIFISPFTYSYRAGLGQNKKTWLEPHIGVYISGDVWNGSYKDSSSWGSNYNSYEPYQYFEPNKSDIDVGLNIGLRMWLAGRVSLDLAFQQGFLEFADNRWASLVYHYTGSQWTTVYNENYHRGLSGSVSLRVGVKLNK